MVVRSLVMSRYRTNAPAARACPSERAGGSRGWEIANKLFLFFQDAEATKTQTLVTTFHLACSRQLARLATHVTQREIRFGTNLASK